MKKCFCVLRTPLFHLLLIVLVGASLITPLQAKARHAAQAKTSKKSAASKSTGGKSATNKKGKAIASSKETAHSNSRSGKGGRIAVREPESRRDRRGRIIADKGSRRLGRRGRAQAESAVSERQAQSLLSKRGRLSKAERRLLTGYRSSRRNRARAIAMARMRAVQARDSALRNVANGNISNDLTTGEDPEVRAAAINALQGRSGTVVVMDPNTGRVYSVVNQQMALRSPVKPCSTVKLIVGTAALHENVFDPNQDLRISANAGLNLTDAVAHSNNPFFQVLGRMLGYERVMQYASNFGFGEKTGINYPTESAGFLPEEGEQETGHMSSHGDGFGLTAIQLAAFTSAIANGGNLYVPHVPQNAIEAGRFTPVLKRRIEISVEDRMRLMAGMIGAVNYGTAKLAYNPLAQVAGKTGTCHGSSDKLGLFTSFSSVDNPQLVVTVITTGSTEAGKRAAEIAGRVYAAISPRFFRERLTSPASASTEIPTGRLNANMR